MQTKPTYVVIARGGAGPDAEDGVVHAAFEADGDASAIARAIKMCGETPFDLVRSDAPEKKSVDVYSHRPTKRPPLN